MTQKRIAVYPGTFDPLTFGHLDVIERAHKFLDHVIVAITDNPNKKPLFSMEERLSLARDATKDLDYVEVEAFEGLLVEYARRKGAALILRGLRELSDFEFEFQQAVINRKLAPDIESVFVMTSPKYFYLSSSAAKEVARLGGPLENFVPKSVEHALREKFPKKGK